MLLRRPLKLHKTALLLLAALTVSGLAAVPAQASPSPTAMTPRTATASDAEPVLSGSGDENGYHLQIDAGGSARSVAVLAPIAAGSWTGYQCLSGNGKYAAVAILPVEQVDDAVARDRGAFAYTVEIATGRATLLPQRVGLKYFSPACGVDDSAVFTRYPGSDQQQTELLTADLAAGAVGTPITVSGQVTSTVPTRTGLVGADGNALVRISSDGTTTAVIDVEGSAYQLRASADGGVDYLTTDDGDTAAHHLASDGESPGGRVPTVIDGSVSRAAGSTTENPASACSVPRLNPSFQVRQPTPAQADWAAQMAAQGLLVDAKYTRPAGYSGLTGMAAYAPNTDFPRTSLKHPAGTSWDTVPRSVIDAIMAQETNLQQATRHAPAGVPGGPLVGNYYGSNAALTTMDPANPDCGYGITQVTSGMRTGETAFTPNGQRKIAVDYQENIAAGLNILQDKWNQLYTAGIIANDGSPKYLENWYFALWAYNSGIQPAGVHGTFGLGWTNNPANPDYPPNRNPYLRDSYNDAKTPGSWPYQERVLGWMGQPQIVAATGKTAYAPATYAGGQKWLQIPPANLFCTAADNNCTYGTPNPTNPAAGSCQYDNYQCWWHAPRTWVAAGKGATSSYTVGKTSSEPASPALTPATSCKIDPAVVPMNSIVVDNQDGASKNLRGCTAANMVWVGTTKRWTGGGTFSYEYGANSAGDTLGAIDTHQVGSGLGGHTLFTHTDDGVNPALVNTGTWTPNLPASPAGQYFQVKVHLPAYVADARNVIYTVAPGNGQAARQIRADQGGNAEKWISLGSFQLWPGASVRLTNSGSDAVNGDVAFDAVAFIPQGAVPAKYPDVKSNSLFYDDIMWLASNGVTGGYADGSFRPVASISRDAMAAFLFRALNFGVADPNCAGKTRRFSDVTSANNFCGVIEWLAARNISTGYQGAFGLGPVDRQAMAAFIFRAKNPGVADPKCTGSKRTFTDVPASNGFCGAIEWLARERISTGNGDGTFSPGAKISRQATAAFLHRAFG